MMLKKNLLTKIPSTVPNGWVLVHNVLPTRMADHLSTLPAWHRALVSADSRRAAERGRLHPLGWNGFRAWFDDEPRRFKICRCGWAPTLGTHYRSR